jgi:hypothetical protein
MVEKLKVLPGASGKKESNQLCSEGVKGHNNE